MSDDPPPLGFVTHDVHVVHRSDPPLGPRADDFEEQGRLTISFVELYVGDVVRHRVSGTELEHGANRLTSLTTSGRPEPMRFERAINTEHTVESIPIACIDHVAVASGELVDRQPVVERKHT